MQSPTREDISPLLNRKEPHIFKDIPDDYVDRILSFSELVSLKENEKITFVQNDVEYIFAIVSGHLTIRTMDDSFIGWRGVGQMVGEVPLISPSVQNVIATSTENLTLLKIPSSNFSQLANKVPGLYLNLCRILVEKLQLERSKAKIIQLKKKKLNGAPVRKIAEVVLFLLGERNNDTRGTTARSSLRLCFGDVAGFVGGNYHNVNSIFREMRKKKIINYNDMPRKGKRKHYHEIQILSLDGLHDVIDGNVFIDYSRSSKKKGLE